MHLLLAKKRNTRNTFNTKCVAVFNVPCVQNLFLKIKSHLNVQFSEPKNTSKILEDF